MKKTHYLVGSMLAIALIGVVLLSGCTRSSETQEERVLNSNSSQSSSETENMITQQSSSSSAKSNSGTKAIVSDGVQTVTTTLDRGIYNELSRKRGSQLNSATITAKDGDLSSCNNKMLIRSYGVEKQLAVGDA